VMQVARNSCGFYLLFIILCACNMHANPLQIKHLKSFKVSLLDASPIIPFLVAVSK
jgi:hypothetical protein